jgi:dolichyl-phosphate beta-glucosyltransferase
MISNNELNNGLDGRVSGKTDGRSNYRSGRVNGHPVGRVPARPQRPFRAPVQNDVFLSVVVPAYNEEKRLPQTLIAISDYLKKQPYGYEIIAVNDGSKDGTAGAVEALIGKVAKLKLIDNRVNHGKGYVVRQGMLAAKGQIRLFTDSDNSTPVEQVEKLLPFFKQGFDLVIGSRDAKGAILDPPQPLIRRFLGEGFGLLTNILAGTWGIGDTQCGFKAMSAKAAMDILPKCKIDRFAFDPEILMLARMKKYKIKEVGILWKNDTRSTVKISSMIKMFLDILRVRANQIKGVYSNHNESKPNK